MFLDADKPDILNVYLLDTADADQKAVEDAINKVFPGAIPREGFG